MNRIVVTLEAEDLIALQAILADQDESAALKFIESRIATKLPQKGTAPCDSTRLNPYLVKSDREG